MPVRGNPGAGRAQRIVLVVCAALMCAGAGCRLLFSPRSNTIRDVTPPCASSDLVVTGLVESAQSEFLLPRSETRVRLWDASMAGAEPKCVAEAAVEGAKAFPVPFSLALPKADVRPNHEYFATASVSKDGSELFRTDTEYAVPVGPAPVAVRLVVMRVK